MDIVSVGPVAAASFVWHARNNDPTLTVVCKTTYRLMPGESPLAGEQEAPNEDDNHWNDDTERSLYSACDFVPFKARADVMLVGHAFAPRQEPVRSLVAGLSVAGASKAIEVHCDRVWHQDGSLREGAPFAKMRLRYERAAGGPGTWNPVGMRPDAPPDGYGNVPIPNLQPPGAKLSHRGDRIDPIGFGPIAPSWPPRAAKLGRHITTWHSTGWRQIPLPVDFDAAYFNAAPADQQVSLLRGGEPIVLENLHPEHARLATRLAAGRPRAFLERRGASAEEIALACDTLWIDTDRAIATLTWRAQIQLAHPREEGRVVLQMEESASHTSSSAIDRAPQTDFAAAPAHSETADIHIAEIKRQAQALTAAQASMSSSASVLPFQPAQPGQPAASALSVLRHPIEQPQIAWSDEPTQTGTDEFESIEPDSEISNERDTLVPPEAPPPPAAVFPPWATPQAARPIAPPMESPRFSAPVRVSPVPPPVPSPVPSSVQTASTQPAAPPAEKSSPWAAGAAPPRPSSGDLPWSSSPTLRPPAPQPETPVLPLPLSPRAEPSVTLSSPLRPEPVELVNLIWFTPACIPRFSGKSQWREVLDAMEDEPRDVELDQASESLDVNAVENRREVFEILTRADATDGEGLHDALERALRASGKFVPPFLLIAGDLTFPFDEFATLTVTLATVTPLIGGDPVLQATVDSVSELARTPHLEGSTGVVEGLTARVREAFASGKQRAVPAGYLEPQTERALLEQRKYQKRAIFGDRCIRSLFVPSGSQIGIPAYMPESLTLKLPMFQRFRARLLVEAHTRQDQYETHPIALRVMAVGQVLPRDTMLPREPPPRR